MDAFEELVAECLLHEGYWVQTSVRVRLSKDQKHSIGRPTTPDWEIDVVAFKGSNNELLAIECKSFFDSTGVQASELAECVGISKGRYKLFCEPALRQVVLQRLRDQLIEEGFCPQGEPARLCMAVGKTKRGDEAAIRALFDQRGWSFYGGDWLRARLKQLSGGSYRNQVASIVSKILLRD